jgi:electron transport complex protein RnfD
MVFCLLLPNQIHPLYAVAGSFFAIAVVKHSFGGLGSNWLNPALGGWLFARLAWPDAFAKALAGSPLSIIAANLSGGAVHDAPMNMLRMSGAVSAAGSPLDAAVTSFFNNTVFQLTSAELPAGYMDLLFSRAPGIIADRGLAALLAGSIIIIAFRISCSWSAAVFLAVFGFLVWYLGGLPFEGVLWNGDVLFALLSGGTLVTAFILAADPASGVKSKPGILFTAVSGAILSWVFRFRSFEVYGCFTAIALVNVLTPAVRFFEGKLFFSYKRKTAGNLPPGSRTNGVPGGVPLRRPT